MVYFCENLKIQCGECSLPSAASIWLNSVGISKFLSISMPDLSDVGPPAKGPGYH